MLIPSLVHSTPSMVCWISLAAGMSFHVFKNVFFSIAPEDLLHIICPGQGTNYLKLQLLSHPLPRKRYGGGRCRQSRKYRYCSSRQPKNKQNYTFETSRERFWHALLKYVKQYLDISQRVHFLDRSRASHWQSNIKSLTSVQQGNIQWLTGCHSKTVLVQLDTETLHCLHGFVAEGHLHGDHIVPQTPSTRYFKPLPFLCCQPHLKQNVGLTCKVYDSGVKNVLQNKLTASTRFGQSN